MWWWGGPSGSGVEGSVTLPRDGQQHKQSSLGPAGVCVCMCVVGNLEGCYAGESSGGERGFRNQGLEYQAQGLDFVLEKGKTVEVARWGHDKVRSLCSCTGGGGGAGGWRQG